MIIYLHIAMLKCMYTLSNFLFAELDNNGTCNAFSSSIAIIHTVSNLVSYQPVHLHFYI